jgi:hypothetical protein
LSFEEVLVIFQLKVRETDDLRANSQVNADLNTLISVLESPGDNPFVKLQFVPRFKGGSLSSYIYL